MVSQTTTAEVKHFRLSGERCGSRHIGCRKPLLPPTLDLSDD
jgi:hypothetical protein